MSNVTKTAPNATATVPAVTPNPRAMIRDLGIPKETLEQFKGLVGDEQKIASNHIKECIKKGIQPTPLADWVSCPVCDYRTPNSLLSHIKAKHGSVQAVADSLGIFAEQIQLNSTALVERFKVAGAKGELAKKAKKLEAAAEATAVEDAIIGDGDDADEMVTIG